MNSSQFADAGEVIKYYYEIAKEKLDKEEVIDSLSNEAKSYVESAIEQSEQNKGMIAVLLTLFCYKTLCPTQDIRKHQANMAGGFAGRTVDAKYITPFLKEQDFPAMAESGWLTRAFEHPMPYTMDYPLSMKNKSLSKVFLSLIDKVECQGENPEAVTTYMLQLLIKQREGRKIQLHRPHTLTISQILSLLVNHFTYKYSGHGASRLPTLALYAAYQCMMNEMSRYSDKILCPLESHTSSDSQSGQIGDIQVNYPDGTAFEGIEVKHRIRITPELIEHAYSKFSVFRTDRYYLLTTANMDGADWEGIEAKVRKIRNSHGCQVIVNGVYSTINYYLRLLQNPSDFIDKYVTLLESDEGVKYPQKVAWNELTDRQG